MTIKRKIQIINMLPLLLAVVVMLILLSSYATISKIIRQDMIATAVMKGAFELEVLTTEYMMNPEVRPKKQWLLQYSLINDLLNTIELEKVDDKRLLAKIRREHADMKDNFQDLTALYERQKKSQEKTLVPAGYENNSREHLLVRSHSLASDAAYMSDVNHSSLMNHFRQVRLLAVSSVIFMMILMVGVSVAFGRSIIEPVTKLHQAADIIAGGNLNYRVGIETSDEIGLLSNAFDSMTLKLKKSRTVLEDEVAERRVAEEALDKSRQELQSVYNAITDFITVISTDYRILRVNKVIEELWGKDLINSICYKAYQGRDEICPDCPTKKSIETGKPSHSFQQATGSSPPVEIFAFPIIDKKGEVTAVVEYGRDITERLRRETALKESEEKYRRYFTTVPTAWAYHKIIVDENNRPSDYVFLEVNRAFEKLTGLKQENIIGRRVTEVLPGTENDPADWIGKYGEVALTGREIKFDNYSEAIDKWFLVSASSPEKGYFIVVFEDITDRKLAELSLKKEKEKLQKYLDISAVMVVMINADQEVTLINKKGCEILGYKENEIIGENWFDLFLPQSLRDDVKTVFNNLMAGDIEPVEYYENQVITKNGEERLIAWYNTVFRDNNGNIIETLGSGVDITEHRAAEEKIRKSLEEKEMLIKEIHHRVKNNMTVISSLLKLQADKVRDEKYKEMFNDSIGRIQSMAFIHEKLYRSEDLARVNFSAYIKDMVRNMFASYGLSPGRVTLNMEVEDIRIGIDNAIPLGLIVNELISNSLKHAFPESREGEVRVTLSTDNKNETALTISDNGAGFPEGLDFRKSESLGLNLVTALTRQIQGNIDLNRETGTEFRITFRRNT